MATWTSSGLWDFRPGVSCHFLCFEKRAAQSTPKCTDCGLLQILKRVVCKVCCLCLGMCHASVPAVHRLRPHGDPQVVCVLVTCATLLSCQAQTFAITDLQCRNYKLTSQATNARVQVRTPRSVMFRNLAEFECLLCRRGTVWEDAAVIDLHSLTPATAKVALVTWFRYLRFLSEHHGGINPWPERKTAVIVTGVFSERRISAQLRRKLRAERNKPGPYPNSLHTDV